jgi:predicted nucleotidyltransferase component of viral defense system
MDIKSAYLAGGTALALQLGHRISVDLDFFTKETFDEKVLSKALEKNPEFVLETLEWRTILGKIGETKFSIFYYKYDVIDVYEKYEGINILGLKDIAAMKIHAIEERGSKRDFIDVYFLSKHFSMKEMLSFYEQKYKSLDDHLYSISKALGYFEAADTQDLPQMLVPLKWDKVKEYFEKESLNLVRENFS